MLVRASVASCRVMESATAAASSSSLSARRDNERASRNNAASIFADGGSGTSDSVTAPILDCPPPAGLETHPPIESGSLTEGDQSPANSASAPTTYRQRVRQGQPGKAIDSSRS